ncbi:branched-chain amino acid ABC transporter permease [Winogradskyella sp.]|uniref:branched-chain amino acid ABC transporter permease n=1 Tax=Winogradskyella sp. TaxID=1883156 RepID=UPI00260E62AC|nr:branched-chain amino acid ABC transporter permease [Winogradskyella sp.]
MIQVVFNLLASFSIYLLISISFTYIYKSQRFFHIAHAVIITLGTYFTYSFSIQLNLPLFLVIPISILICIGLMLLVNRFIYKPLHKKNVKSWQMLIASLGVYVVLQNVISIVWGDNTLSFRTWPVKEGHQFLGAYITDVQIITILACSVLVGLSWLFLERTSTGQKIKAVSSNPELASILGISKDKAIIWSFVIGSGLAACTGILIAADTDMTPTMGFNWLLYGVVAMIIGGMGKLRYLILGSLLLATAQHLAAYYLDSKWMNATAYIILIIFLYFKPYGFSGKPLKKTEI